MKEINYLCYMLACLAVKVGVQALLLPSSNRKYAEFRTRYSAMNSDAYHEARREAEYHALERGKLFKSAEDAIRRGDGAGANALAAEGKWHGAMMHAANACAVDEVLADQSGSEIDLHGLFASEAIDVVKEMINGAQTGSFVTFITGKGLNSDPLKGPVLQSAIEKLCTEQKWRFSYDEGIIRVTIPPKDLPKQEHQGLVVGDVIPVEIWGYLRDNEGKEYKFSRLRKAIFNYAVIYVDPRRSSGHTSEVINEFKKIPRDELGISLTIVTPDNPTDHRKLVKKNKIDWCVILSDSEKKLSETVRCRAAEKLLSVLLILDTKTGSVLGIWYEECKEWETSTTGEFVTETVRSLEAFRT